MKETNKEVFNDACNSCHYEGTEGIQDKRLKMHDKNNGSKLTCSDKSVIRNSTFKTQNCVSCHMPSSGSIDIPHVSVHDHYIRKPQSKTITKKDKQALKEFIGLYAINEKNPKPFIKAKAYLNQYEKFEPRSYYLDSAAL